MIDLPESGRVGGGSFPGEGVASGGWAPSLHSGKTGSLCETEQASQATAGGQRDKGSRRWSSPPEAGRSWEIMSGRTKAKTKEGCRCIYAAGNGKRQEVF